MDWQGKETPSRTTYPAGRKIAFLSRELEEKPADDLFSDQDSEQPKPFDGNILIQGDNLLALKALENQYAGRVKCVFIDPPYNTGSAFTQYDDGVEHSIWLTLMRDRLEVIKNLLADDGSLWITIDDNECHYLKVICDETFGRQNFVATCVWEKDKGGRGDADISGNGSNLLFRMNIKTELYFIDHQTNNGIMHIIFLRKAKGSSCQPFNPRSEI